MGRFEVCDRETDEWRKVLELFVEAEDELDRLTVEVKENGNGDHRREQ